MKKIAYVLSFPNVGSWDGKFSGEGRFYAHVYSYANETAERILAKGSYWHNFGDGWSARIDIRQVDAKEAKQIKKNSKGFYGYEWMIDNIVYGKPE